VHHLAASPQVHRRVGPAQHVRGGPHPGPLPQPDQDPPEAGAGQPGAAALGHEHRVGVRVGHVPATPAQGPQRLRPEAHHPIFEPLPLADQDHPALQIDVGPVELADLGPPQADVHIQDNLELELSGTPLSGQADASFRRRSGRSEYQLPRRSTPQQGVPSFRGSAPPCLAGLQDSVCVAGRSPHQDQCDAGYESLSSHMGCSSVPGNVGIAFKGSRSRGLPTLLLLDRLQLTELAQSFSNEHRFTSRLSSDQATSSSSNIASSPPFPRRLMTGAGITPLTPNARRYAVQYRSDVVPDPTSQSQASDELLEHQPKAATA